MKITTVIYGRGGVNQIAQIQPIVNRVPFVSCWPINGPKIMTWPIKVRLRPESESVSTLKFWCKIIRHTWSVKPKDWFLDSAVRKPEKPGFWPPRVLYQRLKSQTQKCKLEKKSSKTSRKSCRQTERPLRQERGQYKNTTVVGRKK